MIPRIDRRIVGYIILAAGMVVGLWQLQIRFERQLKKEINQLGQAGCLQGRASTSKYNDLVLSIIEGRQDSLRRARLAHDKVQVDLHLRAIHRYQHDFLPVATLEQCRKPILK